MHDHFGLSNIKIVYWLRVLASRAKKLKLHFLACRIFIVNRMFKIVIHIDKMNVEVFNYFINSCQVLAAFQIYSRVYFVQHILITPSKSNLKLIAFVRLWPTLDLRFEIILRHR